MRAPPPPRLPRSRRSLPAALLLTALLVALGGAVAQVRIVAPPDRPVAPGEFVTLVFRVGTDVAVETEAEARTASGWAVLRQPGRLRLEPGRERPVAVTVRVPEVAAAGTEEVVVLALEAAGGLEASVRLFVGELRTVELTVPAQVPATDGATARIRNAGNVPERLTLRIRRAGLETEERSFVLEPGEERLERVVFPAPGLADVVLEDERGVVARRVVEGLGYGVPAPPPFVLAGVLEASLGSDGTFGVALALDGPLSDERTMDLRLDGAAPAHSSLTLATERLRVQLGAGVELPYRLGLPTDLGAAADLDLEGLALGGAVGWVDADRFSGQLAVELERGDRTLALGAGLREGGVMAAARLEERLEPWRLRSEAVLLRGALDAGVALERSDRDEDLRVRGRFEKLGGASGAAVTEVAGHDGLRAFQVRFEVPLGARAEWGWRAEVESGVPWAVRGDLRLSARAGLREAAVGLRHVLPVDEGWSLRTGLELAATPEGRGAAFETGARLALSPVASLDLGGAASWRSGAGLRLDELALRAQTRDDPLALFADLAWEPGEASLGGAAGLTWSSPSWRVALSLGGRYGYGPGGGVTGSLGLRSRYALSLAVPEAASELFGGRRLATVAGRVAVDDRPLAGAELRVGRYRLQTDEEGRFEALVAPGEVTVRLELDSLPVTLQPRDEPRRDLVLAPRERAELDFALIETAVLQGTVLADDDADGVPDAPRRGLAATLRVRDADGRLRSVRSGEDGTFRTVGLPPGPTVVELLALPPGTVPTSPVERELVLRGGVVAELSFTGQPPAARARSFRSSRLRIRRVEPEIDRLPPGTAPLVSAEVQGEVDEMTLTGPGTRVAMTYDGRSWRARLPIPAGTEDGVVRFEVEARRGDEVATRRGQVVIDASLAAAEADPRGPVRPGETLEVRVTAYFAAAGVEVRTPFGPPTAARELEPGRWRAEVPVPVGAADAVHELSVAVLREDGAALVLEGRVRVLGP